MDHNAFPFIIILKNFLEEIKKIIFLAQNVYFYAVPLVFEIFMYNRDILF